MGLEDVGFIQKVLTGIAGSFGIALHDTIIVFCDHGFSCEGELVGYCPEGIVVDAGGAFMWVASEWIGSIGKVKSPSDGGGPDIPPEAAEPPQIPKESQDSPAGESVGKKMRANIERMLINGSH